MPHTSAATARAILPARPLFHSGLNSANVYQVLRCAGPFSVYDPIGVSRKLSRAFQSGEAQSGTPGIEQEMLLFFILSSLLFYLSSYSTICFRYIGVFLFCLFSFVQPALKNPLPHCIPPAAPHTTPFYSTLPNSPCSLPFSISLLLFSTFPLLFPPSHALPLTPLLPFQQLWTLRTGFGLQEQQ